MRDFTTVNNVLSELGRRHGIDGLRLSAESTVGLCLKDGIEVDFEYDDRRNRMYIYTTILALPKEDTERLKLFDAMLELNCLEKGLPCGSLSIHRQRDAAICQLGLPVTGLTSSMLENSLRELLTCRDIMETTLGRILKEHADIKARHTHKQSTMSLLGKRAR